MTSLPSPRLTRALEFIRDFIRKQGISPSYADIAEEFGFSSINAARKLVDQLLSHQLIERDPGIRRGIRLAEAAGLPVVGRVAAGSPILAGDNVEAHLPIHHALFRPRADFLLRVQGQSMKDVGILDGDYVGVKQQEVADNGQIVVARLPHPKTGEEEITLKRYFRKRDVVTLKAENPAFAPIEINLSAGDPDSQERPPLVIEGLYVGLIRMHDGARR